MKKRKKYAVSGMAKDAMGFTVGAVAMGVGAQVASSTGAVGVTASGALSSMAGMMPVMGTISGAGHVMKATKSMFGKKKIKGI